MEIDNNQEQVLDTWKKCNWFIKRKI